MEVVNLSNWLIVTPKSWTCTCFSAVWNQYEHLLHSYIIIYLGELWPCAGTLVFSSSRWRYDCCTHMVWIAHGNIHVRTVCKTNFHGKLPIHLSPDTWTWTWISHTISDETFCTQSRMMLEKFPNFRQNLSAWRKHSLTLCAECFPKHSLPNLI